MGGSSRGQGGLRPFLAVLGVILSCFCCCFCWRISSAPGGSSRRGREGRSEARVAYYRIARRPQSA